MRNESKTMGNIFSTSYNAGNKLHSMMLL